MTMFYALSASKRIRIQGDRARLENLDTHEASPWYQLEDDIAETFVDWSTGEWVFHYMDGSYRRAKLDKSNWVLTFEQRVFPQWKVFDGHNES